MTERVGGPAETQPAEKKGKKRGREGKEGDWGLGRERERERERRGKNGAGENGRAEWRGNNDHAEYECIKADSRIMEATLAGSLP